MSKLVLLLLFCLTAPLGAQATYPEYITECAGLLEKLKDSPVSVPPYEGRPATAREISESNDLARWIERNGGQLARIDDGVSGSKIFRWTSESGESRVIKAYFNKNDARDSDRQFKFLAHNFPVGLLDVIPRLGKYRTLRFYQDVHGVTLAHLIQEAHFSQDLNSEIQRLYTEHLDALKARIVERYGANNVYEIQKNGWNMVVPDLHLAINTSPGHTIGLWIHDENVLFDSKRRVFWIIDPE